jgi:hypothetical protein
MVSKMLGPNAVSASSLAKRAGVTQSTLSRFREAKLALVHNEQRDTVRGERIGYVGATESFRVT